MNPKAGDILRDPPRPHPHRPDGGYPVGGLLLVTMATLVTAIVLAFVVNTVVMLQSRYWVVTVPTAMGIGIGLVGKFFVKKTTIRNPLLGLLIGFVSGAAGMVSMHFMEYRISFDMDQAVRTQPGLRELFQLEPGQFEARIASASGNPQYQNELRQLYGNDGQSFVRYMHMKASRGVRLTMGDDHGEGLNLGYLGSWIFWTMEMLIAAASAASILRRRMIKPCCAARNA